MVLTEYIKKSAILTEMKANNKHDAIMELGHHLFDDSGIQGVGAALDQIMAREMTESTGIGHAIAIPHARVPGLKQLVCAVGRIKDGIDFQAIDRQPVKLIFLICYAPTQQTNYLNFIATIAKLLQDEEHFDALLKADTPDEMHAILQDISESLATRHEEYERTMQADPAIAEMEDAHTDLVCLARLQLYQEILTSTRSGKNKIKNRIENIRGLIEPRILRHYDRLHASRAPALVPVEGDTCQGCFMRLASQFVQQVRHDPAHLHTCPNCSRYIYVV